METPKEINKLALDAARKGDTATIKYLFETKALRDLEIINSDNQPLLYVAVKYENYETVKLLIQYGANINAKERDDEWTPLHRAAYDNNLPILKLLLEKGADYKSRNTEGLKAFDLGNTEVKRSISNFVIDKAQKLEHRVETLESKLEALEKKIDEILPVTNKQPHSPKLFK